MIMRLLNLAPALLVAACGMTPLVDLPSRSDPFPMDLPAMRTFSGAPTPDQFRQSNASLVHDFLELSFQMESGRELEIFSRFEGPVTLALTTSVTPVFSADLDALLGRLQREAKLPISRINDPATANILIETLPRRKLRQLVPHAACFVVPRVSSWQEFRKNRRSGALDWTTLERREKVTIFIPDDVPPQEARDCLHEEIAQALGPLNDIYRLAHSTFNDDNIHTILTSFDMLILRITYDESLKSGMTKDEVAKRLPAILQRLNPSGGDGTPITGPSIDRAWVRQIETALAPRGSQAKRTIAARRAVQIARQENWNDNRLGFSLLALGRMALGSDGPTAPESFAEAFAVYSALYGADDIHTSHAALQLAAFNLSRGEADETLSIINTAIPSVRRAENAALLATLLMLKAEALDHLGRVQEAATVRLDSLGWARYGFGSDTEIRGRLREISRLRPRNRGADLG